MPPGPKSSTQPGAVTTPTPAQPSPPAPTPTKDQPPTGPAPTEALRIVAFGDSLTAGLGLAQEDAYPAQLQRRLEQTGHRYTVVNAGVSGDTTAGGVRRVDWVLKTHPSIVILELGTNDGLRGLKLDQTEANLRQIIERLRASGSKVVLVGMKLPPNYGAEYTHQFSALFERLAKQYQLLYLPFFLHGVAAQPSLNQADGIHPTADGYRIIVEHMLSAIQPFLKKDLVATPASS